jgi:glycosyltransferase involved in cell wall biosynthesis
MPKVSAIITTFNRERFLRSAIESVLVQTYTDFELLILDNSSKDGTPQLVSSFKDPRIRYLRHQEMNISRQRNLALREALGEYVAFLDDDDEWMPRKLELLLRAFSRGSRQVALTYGALIWVDAESRELGRFSPRLRGKVLKGLLAQDVFTGSASNPMLRASALRAVGGYDEQISTGEDWELYLRLAQQYEVEFVPEVIVRIRQHAGPRLIDRLEGRIELERMVFERFNSAMDAALKSEYMQKIGGKLCRVGRLSEGRREIFAAIATRPLNVRAYAQYLFSFAGTSFYRRMHWSYRRLMTNAVVPR